MALIAWAKYRSGLTRVMSCAHPGIDSIGVKIPLISINTILKNQMTNIACWVLSLKLETSSPNEAIANMWASVNTAMSSRLPLHTYPNTIHDSSRHENTMKNATAIYGIILQTMNVVFRTGVTLICSMVPLSFSETMLSAGRKPHIMVTAITISAGIINAL